MKYKRFNNIKKSYYAACNDGGCGFGYNMYRMDAGEVYWLIQTIERLDRKIKRLKKKLREQNGETN